MDSFFGEIQSEIRIEATWHQVYVRTFSLKPYSHLYTANMNGCAKLHFNGRLHMVDMAEFSGSMDLAQEQVLLVVCSTQVQLHVSLILSSYSWFAAVQEYVAFLACKFHFHRACFLAKIDKLSVQGDGVPPSEARGFCDWLESGEAPLLPGTSYSVCALGDTYGTHISIQACLFQSATPTDAASNCTVLHILNMMHSADFS